MRRQPHAKLSLTNLEDRLTPTGWLDPDFGTSGIVDTGLVTDLMTSKVEGLPDGDILVYGVNQQNLAEVIRYNSDGSKDTAFGVNGSAILRDSPLFAVDIKSSPDGKIYLSAAIEDSYTVLIFRLGNDGVLDTSFGGDGVVDVDTFYMNYYRDPSRLIYDNSRLIIQPDNTIMFIDMYSDIVRKYQEDGTLIHSSSISSGADIVSREGANGSTLVGWANTMGGQSRHEPTATMARLNPQGNVDEWYKTEDYDFVRIAIPLEVTHKQFTSVEAITMNESGEAFFIVRVAPYSTNGVLASGGSLHLVKLTPTGQLDTSFSDDGIQEIAIDTTATPLRDLTTGANLLADGRIVIISDSESRAGYMMKVFNPDGTVDQNSSGGEWLELQSGLFGTTSHSIVPTYGSTVLPDGRIAVLTAGSNSNLLLTVVDPSEPTPTGSGIVLPPVVPPVLPPVIPVLPPELPMPVRDPIIPLPDDVEQPTTGLPVTPPSNRVITLPEELDKLYIQPAGTLGDFNGDRVVDVIRTEGPTVTVLDGVTGSVIIPTFAPFEASYTGELNTAVMGFLYGSETKLVIAPRDGGGPVVAIYNTDGTEFTRFFGLEDKDFRGGLGIATGPMTSDPYDDLIVTAGQGGGPRVAIYSGGSLVEKEIRKVVP
ncbi:MAG: hypothetical protein ACRC8S_22820, partial [Fimbriiglobus sp.]